MLNKNQSVFTFSSYRSLKKVEGIENVKFFVIHDNMYIVIKSSSANKLFLQLYDSSSFSYNFNNPSRQFDLSWQQVDGSADLSRENESYFVKVVKLNRKNMTLMNAVLVDDSKTIEHLDHILLMSIDEKLYWINYVENETEYSIETILVMRSKIVAIECIRNLLIVLEASVLTLYYASTEHNILSRKEVYLGQVESFEFVHEKCCFVYSNGLKIVCLYLLIPAHGNNHYETVEIELSNICAITYVKELNLILGISENNLFYHIPLKNNKLTLNSDEFVEIDSQHVNEIKNINRVLDIKRRNFLNLEKMYEEEQKQLQLMKTLTNNELESEQKILCKRIYNLDGTVNFEINLNFCITEAYENFKVSLSGESERNTNVICIQTKTSDKTIKLVLSKKDQLKIESISLYFVVNLHQNPRLLNYLVKFEEKMDDQRSEQKMLMEHSRTLLEKIKQIINKQEINM